MELEAQLRGSGGDRRGSGGDRRIPGEAGGGRGEAIKKGEVIRVEEGET